MLVPPTVKGKLSSEHVTIRDWVKPLRHGGKITEQSAGIWGGGVH